MQLPGQASSSDHSVASGEADDDAMSSGTTTTLSTSNAESLYTS